VRVGIVRPRGRHCRCDEEYAALFHVESNDHGAVAVAVAQASLHNAEMAYARHWQGCGFALALVMAAAGAVGGCDSTNSKGRGSGGMTADAGCSAASCAVDAGPADAATPTCSQISIQSGCDLRADCHSVFTSGGGCSCDGGSCCMQFSRCADGKAADCAGPALCKSMSPDCPAPYAVSYTGSCYEGCVRQSACPSPTCPSAAPTDGTSCGPVDHPCFYENCATTGRTLATCSGGA
jgi:hypothetical protein